MISVDFSKNHFPSSKRNLKLHPEGDIIVTAFRNFQLPWTGMKKLVTRPTWARYISYSILLVFFQYDGLFFWVILGWFQVQPHHEN
jgi:hypothetical protein